MKKKGLRRFIPACAGNAQAAGCRLTRVAVHPRVCGERYARALEWMAQFGSSPRVRGTLAELLLCRGVRRFIPACAGNA